MDFGEFSTDYGSAVSHTCPNLNKRLSDPMWRLKEDDRTRLPAELLEPFSAVFRPSRRKSEENERLCGEARNRQGRCNRTGPGNWLDADAGVDGEPDQLLAWIRHQRHAGIGDECHVFPGQQAGDERRRLSRFIMFVKTRRRGRDRVARQQMRGPACVFGSDQADLAEDAESPGRDVFEVADRRRDEEQRAWQMYIVLSGVDQTSYERV